MHEIVQMNGAQPVEQLRTRAHQGANLGEHFLGQGPLYWVVISAQYTRHQLVIAQLGTDDELVLFVAQHHQ